MVYYRFNMRAIRFRECWTLARGLGAITLVFGKLFRIDFGGWIGHRGPSPLSNLILEEEFVPLAIRDQLTQVNDQLEGLGFVHQFYHTNMSELSRDECAASVLRHESGQAVAIVAAVRHFSIHPPLERVTTGLLSELSNGTLLITSNHTNGITRPRGVDVAAVDTKSVEVLWSRHLGRLDAAPIPAKEIKDREAAVAVVEKDMTLTFEDQLARGLIEPMSEEAVVAARARASIPIDREVRPSPPAHPPLYPTAPIAGDSPDDAPAELAAETMVRPVTRQDAAVLDEIERFESKPTNGTLSLAVVVITAWLLFGTGVTWWSSAFTLLIVFVLVLHELGHYVAMRALKYRNLKMFFVPFFGAGLSGRRFNVPGWQKVLVSLAGPVPGIVLGAVLGTVAISTGYEWLMVVALALLLVNAFNLLPILPLDGGWVANAVLFCRNSFFDVAFRGGAAAILLGMYLLFESSICLVFAVIVAMGVPMALRIHRVVRCVEQRHVTRASVDDEHIPREAAVEIAREVRRDLGTRRVPTSLIAQLVVQVFERINARAPSAAASSGLLALHAAGLLGALAVAVVFMFVGYGGFEVFSGPDSEFLANHADLVAVNAYDCSSGRVEAGDTSTGDDWNTLVATFPDATLAATGFAAMAGNLPDQAAARVVGQTLFIRTLDDDAEVQLDRAKLLGTLAADVVVERGVNWPVAYFAWEAPTEELARRIEDELTTYYRARCQMPAPWHPEHEVTNPATDPHLFARQTLVRLEDELYGDAVTWLGIASVALRGGPPSEMEGVMKNRRLDAVDRLTEQGVRLDPEVVRLFKLVNTSMPGLHHQPEQHELNAYLGYRDFDPSMVLSKAKGRYACLTGRVARNGRVLRATSIRFVHLFDGMDAFCRWLCKLGCTKIRYGFVEES